MGQKITRTLIKAHTQIDREIEVTDSEVRGFFVRFRPGRPASYFFRYRQGDGSTRKLSIGLAAEIDPEDAREIAKSFRTQLAQSLDPSVERRRVRDNPTVAQLAAKYMSEHAAKKKKPRSAEGDQSIWDMHILPVIGNRTTASIDQEDILNLQTRMAHKPFRANAIIALLSKAMNLAEVWKFRPQNSNPCKFVKKFPVKSRERILTPEELAALGAALADHEKDCPEVCTLIRVLILTGARLREVMAATFEQMDVRRKILILEDSKTGQGIIRLSDQALETLTQIDRKGSPWLIPGPETGHPIRSPWNAWKRICGTANIKGLRIHDLRHIFGSYAHHYGASQKTIATLLRHKQLATTSRYIQDLDDEVQGALNRSSTGLSEMLQGQS